MLDAPCLSSHSPTKPVEVGPTDGDQTQMFRFSGEDPMLAVINRIGAQYRVETKTISWLHVRNLPVNPTFAFRTTRNLSPTALRLPSIYNTVTTPPIAVARTRHLALTLSVLSLYAMLTVVHDGWTTPGRLYVLHTARSFRRSWQLHRTVEGQSTRLQYAVRRAAVRTCCLRFEGLMPNDAVSLNRFRTDTRCSNSTVL